MKKLVTLALLSLLAALSAGTIRCEAMGGMSSLLDTKNFGMFPQRVVTGAENLAIGGDFGETNTSGFGSVRYMMFDNMGLQVNVKTGNADYKQSIINPVQDGSNNMTDSTAYNRVDLIWGMKMSEDMLVGAAIKFYSNSSASKSSADPDKTAYDREHSLWYMSIRPGFTMNMGSNILDLGLNFGFGSWDGKYSSTNAAGVETDHYKDGYQKVDGWMDMNLNARYYMKGDKIDFAPYAAFNYASKGWKATWENASYESSYESSKSQTDFLFGSGIHLRPVEGINVFNELEFDFVMAGTETKESATSGSTTNTNDETTDKTTMSILPTYRAGVESIHELDPKNNWLAISQLKLWGGFSKKFHDVSGTNKNNENNAGTESSTEYEYTKSSTGNEVNLTYGLALTQTNMTFELSSVYDDNFDMTGVKLDLVYNFKR